MSDTRAGQRWTKIDCEPIAAIELRAYPGDKRTLRWGLMLVWFMRFVAVLWMSHSLLNWCQILGVGSLGRTDLAQLDDHAFAATVFFATLDPVAAVGLWLATPWGGVTWLVAVAAQIFAAVMLPHLFENGFLLMATNGALVACYFVLTFAASRERHGS
jgi:hypothetical protein